MRKDDLFCLYLLGCLYLVLIFVTGFRPLTVGSDTALYTWLYEEMLRGEEPSFLFEPLYHTLALLFAKLSIAVQFFFASVSAVSLLLLFLGLREANKHVQRPSFDIATFVYASLFLISSSTFLSVETNVIRQGVACFAVILFYLSLLNRPLSIIGLFSASMALGFHYTSVLFIIPSVVLRWSYRSVMFGTLILGVAYCLGVLKSMVQMLSSFTGLSVYERIISYGADSSYKSGIRLDFAIFSMVLGLLLHSAVRRLIHQTAQSRCFNFLKIYWLLLIPFFILGFGAYSDRFLLNAWVYFTICLGVVLANVVWLRGQAVGVALFPLGISSALYVLNAQGIV